MTPSISTSVNGKPLVPPPTHDKTHGGLRAVSYGGCLPSLPICPAMTNTPLTSAQTRRAAPRCPSSRLTRTAASTSTACPCTTASKCSRCSRLAFSTPARPHTPRAGPRATATALVGRLGRARVDVGANAPQPGVSPPCSRHVGDKVRDVHDFCHQLMTQTSLTRARRPTAETRRVATTSSPRLTPWPAVMVRSVPDEARPGLTCTDLRAMARGFRM